MFCLYHNFSPFVWIYTFFRSKKRYHNVWYHNNCNRSATKTWQQLKTNLLNFVLKYSPRVLYHIFPAVRPYRVGIITLIFVCVAVNLFYVYKPLVSAFNKHVFRTDGFYFNKNMRFLQENPNDKRARGQYCPRAEILSVCY